MLRSLWMRVRSGWRAVDGARRNSLKSDEKSLFIMSIGSVLGR